MSGAGGKQAISNGRVFASCRFQVLVAEGDGFEEDEPPDGFSSICRIVAAKDQGEGESAEYSIGPCLLVMG